MGSLTGRGMGEALLLEAWHACCGDAAVGCFTRAPIMETIYLHLREGNEAGEHATLRR